MGPHRAPWCPLADQLSRGAPEGRRALALRASDEPHDPLDCRRIRHRIGSRRVRAWRLDGIRAVEQSGRVPMRGPTLNSFSARPPAQVRSRPRLPLGPHNGRRVARCPGAHFGEADAPRSRRPCVSTLARGCKPAKTNWGPRKKGEKRHAENWNHRSCSTAACASCGSKPLRGVVISA